MTEEIPVGCARPTSQTLNIKEEKKAMKATSNKEKKEETMIKVGQKAPDFTAPAYHNGKFTNVKLSDYSGKWVVLCFYPGDFTFV